MIEELLSFARLNNISGRESVSMESIHWVIDLDSNGNALQISPTCLNISKRGKQFSVPRNYHLVKSGEKITSVGKNQGGWLPPFLFGRLSDWVQFESVKSEKQEVNRRKKTKELVRRACKAMPNHSGIQAVNKFIDKCKNMKHLCLPTDYATNAEYKNLLEGKEQLTFRHMGNLVINDKDIRQWWAEQFEAQRTEVMPLMPNGLDLTSGKEMPIPSYHPIVTGKVSLVSFDKAPFQSYGLEKCTASMGIDTSEAISAALSYLWEDKDQRIYWGKVRAVFWAMNQNGTAPVGFAQLFQSPDSVTVRDFLNSVWGSVPKALPNAKFYLAMFTQTEGRIVPISWNVNSLQDTDCNLNTYFRTIMLPWKPELPSQKFDPELPPTIDTIAKALVKKSPNVAPPDEMYGILIAVALLGKYLPQKFLNMAITRQIAEVTKGPAQKSTQYEIGQIDFESRLRARTALIKLYLSKKGVTINMNNHTEQNDSAYLCGRLLAMLDKIHIEAHKNGGGTNSSPANRSYSAASTTPALAFPQLCKLARYHLNKIGKGWANCLEHGYKNKDTGEVTFEGLKHICAHLKEAAGCNFPRTLSLEEQGRFAIGFYYERCRQWPKKKEDNTNQTDQNKESEPDAQE